MSARKPKSSSATFFSSTFVAIAVFGAASSAAPRAHAQGADPFAGEPPAVPRVERRRAQPASARVGAGRFGRELPDRPRRTPSVVRLPGAGDPRPLRQLPVAGHAGPPVAVLPAHRRRPLGLRLGRHRLQAHAHRRCRAVRSHDQAVRAGALRPARHADLLERHLVRAGAGGAHRQPGPARPAAAGRGHGRPLGPDRRLEKLGRDRRPLRRLPRLPPGHGPGPQHRRAHRRLRQPRRWLGPAGVPRQLPLLPARRAR